MMIAIFIMGNFDLPRIVISSMYIKLIGGYNLYALGHLAFLVTKLGSPAVKNGSPGLRASAIFNP